MKHLNIIGATLAAACLGTFAHAELTDVTVELIDNGMDGITTGRVIAEFDDPDDIIYTVYGHPTSPMSIIAPGGLWNDDTGTGNPVDDTPALSGPFDTWVGFAGDLSIHQPQFSPNFWGVEHGGTTHSVLVDGTTSLWDDNSGYFILGGEPVHSIDSNGRVTIAQFSFHGTWARMTGAVQYTNDARFIFNVLIPAPGALAVLGIGALAPSRRRRPSS